MASTAVRLKPKLPKTLANLHPFLRHSSSTTPPPPPPPNPDPTTSSPDSKPAPTPYFSDIKAHLRQPISATRQIPVDPPKPGFLFQEPSSSPSYAPSLEKIRKDLAEFRRRSAPPSPSPSSSSQKPISLKDIYNRKDDAMPDLSIDTIRGSLRQLRQNSSSQKLSDKLRGTGSSSLSIKGLQDSLNSKPSDFSNLPPSIFRKELEQDVEKDGKEVKGRNTDFLKMYTYEELGEKLRMLRPAVQNEEKGQKKCLFSLHELNERLAKLRNLEEKEKKLSPWGESYELIQDGLVKLKNANNENKNSSRNFFIFGGFMSQDIEYGPEKEHLVEKYFHPDLMSSEEKMKLELKKVREEFKMSESDCGSARVQVAQLTTKIKHLSSVLHKKDKHSQKGLQAMVQRRRKLLKYLRRTDWGSYCFVISKLGLRDTPEYRA